MLNIKKAITVSVILFNNLVSLTLILMFCCLNNLYAQMPGDFPEGKEFDPRHPDLGHPRIPGEINGQAAHPTSISENVELVGATEGAVFDVFVLDNYAYICAGGVLVILDVSVPALPTKVKNIALPEIILEE